MPATTPDTSAAPPVAPADRLNDIIRRVESGQAVAMDELLPLSKVADRPTRAVAKRLLAKLLVEQVQRDAGTLLCEACADLDYRHSGLIAETTEHIESLGWFDSLFDLQASAAESAARRHLHVPALVHAQNAAALDFRHGSQRLSRPDNLRRLLSVYEQVARESLRHADITPAGRGERRSPADGKLRLAHITCQLVDGGHSPSRVVDALLKYADSERFDNYLVVTEALSQHATHADPVLISPSSDVRAPARIKRYEGELGIPVIRPRTLDSFLAAAADLHRQMAERRIDIAFFHGSIATPTDWLLCAWQAAPWQFDRGFGMPLHCPAVDYQFFEFEETMETLAFQCRERGIPYGFSPHGSVDLSAVETAEPLPRGQLGIPADHVILGTIGNHLPHRMSKQFCETVAAVLRANPKATYVIVGPGNFNALAGFFGADLVGRNGPGSRVRFVGATREAERWTATFDIYVNEYPGGGGLTVCEAMAAGKPVVCMRADASALAAVGATYVGETNMVRPATNEAYAQRLSELIADPSERTAFGQMLHARYKAEFDARLFVADMTNRIHQIVSPQPVGTG